MRWFYSSSVRDEFAPSIEVRLRRAEAWSDGAVFDPAVAREALRFRHDSRDGRLGYWTPDLVREFLTEIVPERFTGRVEHYAHVPEALRTWLRFLEHAAALHPHGSDLSELERAVDECARDFPAAFADPAKWGPARITAEAALAAGIDPAAPGGAERLDAFVAEGAPGHDPHVVAAAVTRQHVRHVRSQRMPALPATELPAPERAAQLAAETEAVRTATAFLDWLGDGRATTQQGNLRKADAVALAELLGTGDATESFVSAADLPGLNWHTGLVLGTGLARRVKQRLVPVAKNAGLARDPYALLLAASKVEALWQPQRPEMLAPHREHDVPLRLLVESLLGDARGTAVPVAEVRRRVTAAVYGDDDSDELRNMMVAMTLHTDVDHILTAMHRLGMVEFDGEWETGEPDQIDRTADVSVALTELGRHLLWTRRREAGLVAPVVGELTDRPAAVMLMSVGEFYGRDTGAEEIRRWIAAHGDDPARLVEAIASNPFRTAQSTMLGAAADAVGPQLLERAARDRRLEPIVRMIGNLHGHVEFETLMAGTESQRAQAARGMAEQALEMLEDLGPEGFVQSMSELPREAAENLVALITESGHPDRWLVELFADEVAPLLAGPQARRRAGLEAARDRAKHVKRKKKKRPKRRRR
ncbi:hypothetical protein [Glycomyces tarimensis]